VHDAVRVAAGGDIAILGVTPDRPETGYGYIRVNGAAKAGAHTVERFVEKPDIATAEGYLQAGGYFWNAGMFVLKASTWMSALERFRPDIAQACKASWAVRATDDKFVRPGKAEFAAVPSESVDYAVMEKCPGSPVGIRMVALNAGWNDLGAWEAVWQVSCKDAQGNALVVRGDCDCAWLSAQSRCGGGITHGNRCWRTAHLPGWLSSGSTRSTSTGASSQRAGSSNECKVHSSTNVQTQKDRSCNPKRTQHQRCLQ